ncbi:MAG TPA: hypothetical protein VNL18_15550 [Gemmatimonadales bacterium]|nr:hypothetical protein [Gemmatimonadales bacterium]
MNAIATSLLVVGMLACLGGGPGLPEPAKPTDLGAKQLAANPVREFNSRAEWERSPWARVGDLAIATPVFVVVALDGAACVVTDREWGAAQPGAWYVCAAGWRVARREVRP